MKKISLKSLILIIAAVAIVMSCFVISIFADNGDKTVVIGTHGAVVRGLLAVWLGVPLERLLEVPRVPNGTVTEVEIDGDSVRVVKLGFGDFLEERTGVNGVD